jgi:hypothetical protein
MSERRKLAAILVSDIAGFSRLAGADEDRILAHLRALRSDLIDPTIAVHNGRVVKRTGDGSIVEFRSVVDAVNCAIEIERAMVERNAEVAPESLRRSVRARRQKAYFALKRNSGLCGFRRRFEGHVISSLAIWRARLLTFASGDRRSK